MNKLIALLLVVSTPAFADPPSAAPAVSPWGSSPYVVAYTPPAVTDHSHRGFTLEFALGGGTTSLDESAGSATFAIGGWLSHDVALAFRVTGVGAYSLVGGSVQYYATDSLWLGGGLGSFSERTMDDYYGTDRVSGGGGFVRTGYNFAGKAHVLYVSGELQAGSIDGELRGTALVALGYQLL